MTTAVVNSNWFNDEKDYSATAVDAISYAWSIPSISKDKNIIVNTDVLDKRTSKIIGTNGVKRFEEFKQYQDGWDHGSGEALSLRSVAIMERLVNNYSDFPCEPSLFFTREGNLQLGWEDKNGNSIELEFYPDRIEFFIESLNQEGAFSISEPGISALISLLNSV